MLVVLILELVLVLMVLMVLMELVVQCRSDITWTVVDL